MKSYSLPLLMLLCIHLHAQEKKSLPVFTGLYAPYATQPGIKIGVSFDYKAWQIEKELEVKSRKIYLSPQLGLFRRFSNHTSYLVNTDIGYYRASSARKLYAASSLGLGYLMENQTLSSTVDLSNGDITNRDKALRTYFLPTLNFEFGKDNLKKMGWYTKLSYGRQVSQLEDSGFFALEFGIRIHLRRATSSSIQPDNG